MKATVTIMSLLLAASVGGLGYGYYLYDRQAVELNGVCEARDALSRKLQEQGSELQGVCEARDALSQKLQEQGRELQGICETRDALSQKLHDQGKELQDVSETRDALAMRVVTLEQELSRLSADASRNKLSPTIAAIQSAQTLIAAHDKVISATTSLAKDSAQDEYKHLVGTMKGRRVVFAGTIRDIGKRIISFSQMYLTLTVSEGYDIKFIFEKDAEGMLKNLSAGQVMILDGYVVSTGDLKHSLTVGGPVVMDKGTYDEALRLSKEVEK